MLTKALIVLLALCGVLWWAGVDFRGLRDSVTDASAENARSVTGKDDGYYG